MTGGIGEAVAPVTDGASTLELLLDSVSRLSLARTLAEIQEIVRTTARRLVRADGATFVLRDLKQCYYVDEDALTPLWKGQRFPLEACVSGWVMLNRAAVAIPDIYADDRVLQDAYRPTFVKSMVMVPVRHADPLAAIGMYWADRHVATREEMGLAQALADSVAVALEHVRVLEELARTVELTSVDPLTGITNRRGWDRALGLRLEQSAELTLGLIDIDHFKRYNDSYGHQAGDELLRDCTRAWQAAMRDADLLARYGGEEFGILLSGLDLGQAVTIAERVRSATPARVTASMGLAPARPGEHPTSLIARADAALYQAKRAGRDRLVVSADSWDA